MDPIYMYMWKFLAAYIQMKDAGDLVDLAPVR